jgi:hypothetical protein
MLTVATYPAQRAKVTTLRRAVLISNRGSQELESPVSPFPSCTIRVLIAAPSTHARFAPDNGFTERPRPKSRFLIESAPIRNRRKPLRINRYTFLIGSELSGRVKRARRAPFLAACTSNRYTIRLETPVTPARSSRKPFLIDTLGGVFQPTRAALVTQVGAISWAALPAGLRRGQLDGGGLVFVGFQRFKRKRWKVDAPETRRGPDELEPHFVFAALSMPDKNDARFLLFLRGPVGDHDGHSLLQVRREGDKPSVGAHREHLGGFGEGLAKLIPSLDMDRQ